MVLCNLFEMFLLEERGGQLIFRGPFKLSHSLILWQVESRGTDTGPEATEILMSEIHINFQGNLQVTQSLET